MFKIHSALFTQDACFMSKHNFIVLVSDEAWKFNYPELSDDSWKPWEGAHDCVRDFAELSTIHTHTRAHKHTHTHIANTIIVFMQLNHYILHKWHTCKSILLSFV